MASESKTSSGTIEPTEKVQEVDVDRVVTHHSEVLVNPDLMNDAVDGENREHEEGMWASFKSHPWACLWAFIMCFTIVSPFPRIQFTCIFQIFAPSSGKNNS